MNFKPSDKVVCILPEDFVAWAFPEDAYIIYGELPQPNHVYTVREVITCPYTGLEVLYLIGIKLSAHASGPDYGFLSEYFRKLEEIQAENREKQEMDQLLKEAQELINLY